MKRRVALVIAGLVSAALFYFGLKRNTLAFAAGGAYVIMSDWIKETLRKTGW